MTVVLVAGLLGSIAFTAVAASATATTTTWTGASTTSSNWATTSNWSSSTAPSGADALSFPTLSSCATGSACYQSNNNIPGLTPDSLSIETPTSTSSSTPGYDITGSSITLGSGGLTSTEVVSSSTFNNGVNQIALPIALGAAQTWSVTGYGPQLTGGLTGSNTLGITLGASNNGSMSVPGSIALSGDNEVGDVSITGVNGSDTGFAASFNGAVILPPFGSTASSLNKTDGNTVSVADASLASAGTIGTLTTSGANVQVGLLNPNPSSTSADSAGQGAMDVDGTATFDSTTVLTFPGIDGTTAGTTYPQLSATGNVSLNGAQLGLSTACGASLAVGNTLTLVTTTGTLSGQLSQPGAQGSGSTSPILNDGVVAAGTDCSGGTSTPTYFQINYTSTTVTATVTGLQSTMTIASVSPTSTTFGSSVTYSATVAPSDGATGTPTGTLTFATGSGSSSTTLCASSLTSSGTGSCTATNAPVGTDTVTATYSGNSTFGASADTTTLMVVAPEAPGTPTNVVATPGDTSAYLAWSPPSSNGGSAIIGYVITPSSGSPRTVGDVTSDSITGLTNGTAYTFTVAAINAAGTGSASVASNSVTPEASITAPGTPTNVVATPGDTSAYLAWSPPSSNGGSAIIGYVITPSSGSPRTVGDVTSDSITGLTNGTAYTFTVAAINAAGTGSASVASNSVTPEAPTPVTPTPVAPTPPAGSTSHASGSSASSTGTASATNDNTSVIATGVGAVTVAQYSSNPVSTLTPSSTGEYFDIQVSSGSSFTTMTVKDCNLNGGTTLAWWNPVASGGSGAWESVSPTPTYSVGPPVCLSTTLSSSSSPTLSELTGTVFAVATAVPTTAVSGFALVGADGGYFNHNAPFANSLPGEHVTTSPIVGAAVDSANNGYWMVSSTGTVYGFGGARVYGSVTNPNSPVVGMAATPDGGGYWIVTSNGTVYAFGNAVNHGDVMTYGITGLTGSHPLSAPITGIAVDPAGTGYWLVAADGGVFNFGSARYFGNTYALGLTGLTGSHPLNASIVGIASTPSGKGYWLVGKDGGVFNFGNASYLGSTYTLGLTGLTGSHPLNKPVVGIASVSDVNGHQGVYLWAADGGVFNLGVATYQGSDASLSLNKPIVSGIVF